MGHKIWLPKSIVLDYIGINLSVHHFRMYFLTNFATFLINSPYSPLYTLLYGTLCRPRINKLDYLLIAGNIFDRHK